MLTIEKQIYNDKPWYKNLKPKRMNPKMKNRPRYYSWLGFIFYNSKKLTEEQTTYIYCPTCHTELISTGSYIGIDDRKLEHFTCNVCGTHSVWDFDMPTPILIESTNSPEYRDRWKIPTYDTKRTVMRYGGGRE